MTRACASCNEPFAVFYDEQALCLRCRAHAEGEPEERGPREGEDDDTWEAA